MSPDYAAIGPRSKRGRKCCLGSLAAALIIEHIEAEAEALVRNLGDWAYSEARLEGARGEFRRNRERLEPRRIGGHAQDGQARRTGRCDLNVDGCRLLAPRGRGRSNRASAARKN